MIFQMKNLTTSLSICFPYNMENIQQEDKIKITTVPFGELKQVVISGKFSSYNNSKLLFDDISRIFERHQAIPVCIFIFGINSQSASLMIGFEDFFSISDVPVIFMENEVGAEYESAGLQLVAISGAKINTIVRGNLICKEYSDRFAKYCFVMGYSDNLHSYKNDRQLIEFYTKTQLILKELGLNFNNITRTWFYLKDIWKWYSSSFNDTRTAFFNNNYIFDNIVPVSTGIGVVNPIGSALAGCFFAVKPRDGLKIKMIESPLQCSALDYKVSFSRAIEYEYPGQRILHVSGTASIDTNGMTLHYDNIIEQVRKTFEVLKALLYSRNMGYKNIFRSIAYLKDDSGIRLFHDYCKNNDILLGSGVEIVSKICREDLLFEIELDCFAQ